jgi:hypothetical protein
MWATLNGKITWHHARIVPTLFLSLFHWMSIMLGYNILYFICTCEWFISFCFGSCVTFLSSRHLEIVWVFFFTSLFVFPDTSQAVFHVSMLINYHVSFPLDNHNTPEYKWLWNETLQVPKSNHKIVERGENQHPLIATSI